ncbi:uncharacterized protein LOC131428921 [Malaya genurostris]|uniref:uncharacterized protein LOC131428921 n=1 Tax=Malaya genurostris TaxID=325434 RepID=UPI0026F3CEB3|nr:uncharacterized protein LOC131428921 [Malaya genurostris]
MSHFVKNKNGHCRLCTEPDDKQDMVACDECDRWFHHGCAGLGRLPTKGERWICIKCAATEEQIHSLEKAMKVKRDSSQKESKMEAVFGEMLEALRSLNENNTAGTSRQVNDDWTVYLKRQALIQLPKFNGSPREWPTFKKIYADTSKEGRFSPLENLNRLQVVLGGYAAKCVQPLMMDPENVPKIIERLEQNFGRPETVYKELLHELTKIRKENKNSVAEIADALENLISNMIVLDREDYLQDMRLVEETVNKLPFNLQIKWAEKLQLNNIAPTLIELSEWLKPHARTCRLMTSMSQNKEKRDRINLHDEKRPSCPACKESHKLIQCNKFRAMNLERRWEVVTKNKLCMNCLASSKHRAIDCWTKRKCNENGCKGNHNRLLHKPTVQIKPKKVEDPVAGEDTSNVHQTKRTSVFYQIIPVTLWNGNRKTQTFAFLDPGSSLTLLDEQVAEELQLKGKVDPLKLKWTQNFSREETESKRVNLQISGKTTTKYALKDVRTVKDINLPLQSIDYEQLAAKYKHLNGLPISSYCYARPKVLIGLNYSHLLLPLDRRTGGHEKPIAIKTKLGWMIFGTISGSVTGEHLMIIQEEDRLMRDMMKRYFSIEDFGVKISANPLESKQLTRAREIIDKTLKYTGKRYEIGLLWREENFKFPDSYNMALKRLIALEQKVQKNETLKTWATETINDYVSKGYAKKLTPEEVCEWSGDMFYLPQFIVINKNKNPPKPRLVFDAAAKVKGVSLNSALLSGPDATTSSFGVIIRFREGPVAVAGDIKEMFSQVGINKNDQRK